MLVSLYNGQVQIHNYETDTIVKSFECTELPVRAARFVQRKNWVVTGSVRACTSTSEINPCALHATCVRAYMHAHVCMRAHIHARTCVNACL